MKICSGSFRSDSPTFSLPIILTFGRYTVFQIMWILRVRSYFDLTFSLIDGSISSLSSVSSISEIISYISCILLVKFPSIILIHISKLLIFRIPFSVFFIASNYICRLWTWTFIHFLLLLDFLGFLKGFILISSNCIFLDFFKGYVDFLFKDFYHLHILRFNIFSSVSAILDYSGTSAVGQANTSRNLLSWLW